MKKGCCLVMELKANIIEQMKLKDEIDKTIKPRKR